MKTYRIIMVLMTAAVFSVLPLSAQNGISQAVEVERDYEGSVVDAVKSPMRPEVNDSLLNFKLNFDYTTFYNPYSNLYEFTPAVSAGPKAEGKVVYPWLYAMLSAAYPWTPSADLYVSPRFGGRFSMTVYFNHDSYWGKVPQAGYSGGMSAVTGDRIGGDRMKNRAGAVLGYRWKKGEAGLRADYSGSMYALNNASGMTRFNHFRTLLSVRSVNPDQTSFYYDINLAYRYFDNRMSVTEHLADADLSLGAIVRGDHRIYFRFGGTFSSFGKWELEPVYRWDRNRWNIRAGVVISSVYGQNLRVGGSRFLVYPDVSVSFEAVRNALWIYAKAYGRNDLYSRYDLFALNPWMDDSRDAYLSSSPLAASFGLRGTVRDRFSYEVHAGWAKVNNYLSFMSVGEYQQLAGGGTHAFTAGGMLKWKSRDFYAMADVVYKGFSDRNAALMTPALDLKAEVEYNYRHRIFVQADCRFRTSCTGAAAVGQAVSYYTVPASVDVGVKVSYAVNPHLAVFVEGNNLANSKIQYFLNYVEPGINIGAGVCLKL